MPSSPLTPEAASLESYTFTKYTLFQDGGEGLAADGATLDDPPTAVRHPPPVLLPSMSPT